MKSKYWKIIISGLVVLLLADVAVLQARVTGWDIGGLRQQVQDLAGTVAELKDWEAAKAEVGLLEVPAVASPSSSTTSKVQSVPLRQGSAGLTKETYIPLGGGTTISQDWVDTSAQVYLDTRQYKIKEAYFEASLRANDGRMWARLVNKNEGNYVVDSQITHNTPNSSLIRSGKLYLPEGNKLYMVQIKSETQQQVFVDNARIRLIVE